jgi:hypothetical protein
MERVMMAAATGVQRGTDLIDVSGGNVEVF